MWPGVRSGSSRSQQKATQLGLESGRGWGLPQYCRPSPGLGEATPAFKVRGQGTVLHSRTGRPLAPEIQEWPSMPPFRHFQSSHPPSTLQTNLLSLIIRLASCSVLTQLS